MLLALIAVALGAATPTFGYTKYYKCTNSTTERQAAVRATCWELESIDANNGTGTDPLDWDAEIGTILQGGARRTTITYAKGLNGQYVPGNDGVINVGWTTDDNSCRLYQMRWFDPPGQAFVPEQIGGVEGGGVAFYNYPNPGDLTWAITNDNPRVPGRSHAGLISLAGVEYAVSRAPLNWHALSQLASYGYASVELPGGGGVVSAASLDEAFGRLGNAIARAGGADGLSEPQALSLTTLLNSARASSQSGLHAYTEERDLASARTAWASAAVGVRHLAEQVRTIASPDLEEPPFPSWWLTVAFNTAVAIAQGFGALAEGPMLQAYQLADAPGLDPSKEGASLIPDLRYRPWPLGEAAVLYPGEYTAIVIPAVGALGSDEPAEFDHAFITPGAHLVVRGKVEWTNPHAQSLVWIDQMTAGRSAIDGVEADDSDDPGHPDDRLVTFRARYPSDPHSWEIWRVVGPAPWTQTGPHSLRLRRGASRAHPNRYEVWLRETTSNTSVGPFRIQVPGEVEP